MLSDPPDPTLLNEWARLVSCQEGADPSEVADSCESKLGERVMCGRAGTLGLRELTSGAGRDDDWEEGLRLPLAGAMPSSRSSDGNGGVWQPLWSRTALLQVGGSTIVWAGTSRPKRHPAIDADAVADLPRRDTRTSTITVDLACGAKRPILASRSTERSLGHRCRRFSHVHAAPAGLEDRSIPRNGRRNRGVRRT